MKSADLKSLAVLPAVVTGGFTPDMTTWENVLKSAKLFLSTALQSGVPFRQFLSVLFALIYAAVPVLDNITVPIDKLIAKPFAAPATHMKKAGLSMTPIFMSPPMVTTRRTALFRIRLRR